ncbi:MAG: hypothetical protein ACK5XN_31010 [Bacteroidota bacterium]
MAKYTPPKFSYKPTYAVPKFSSSQYSQSLARQQQKARELEELREEEERRRLEEYLLQGRQSSGLPTRSARRKDELAYVSQFGQRPILPNRFAYKPSMLNALPARPVKKRKKSGSKR